MKLLSENRKEINNSEVLWEKYYSGIESNVLGGCGLDLCSLGGLLSLS